MDGAFPSEKGQPFDALGGAGGYGRGAPRRGFRGTAENAKTKLCTRWQQGDCRFGDRCNFAHGEDELRKLPPREDGGRFGGGRGRGPGGYGYSGRSGPGPYGRGPGRGGYDDYGYGGYGGGAAGGYGGAPSNYATGPGDRQAGGPGYAAGGAAPDQSAGQRMGGGAAADEVWAANGYPVQGPNGWVMYKVKETGEPYYHNHRTNTTQWERPVDWPANS